MQKYANNNYLARVKKYMTNEKNKKRIAIITAVFAVAVLNLGFGFGFAEKANAGVIFEDNFDDHSDWSPQQYTPGTVNSSTDGSEDGLTECTGCPDGEAKYRGYLVRNSAWADYVGHNTLNIGAENAKGGSGKALTFWEEPIDSCADQSGWCSDSMLFVVLPTNPNEVYISFDMYFDPTWVWAEAGGNMKIVHMSHYDPTVNGEINDWHGPDTGNRPFNVLNLAQSSPDYYSVANFFWMPRYQATWYPQLATPKLSINRVDYEAIQVPGGTTSPTGMKTFEELGIYGEWHQLQYHMKYNTTGGYYSGEPNGVFEIFFDGVTIYSRSDVAWADGEDADNYATPTLPAGWDNILIGGNMHNPVFPVTEHEERFFAVDNYVISTSYVDPNYVIGGGTPDTTPPTISSFEIPAISTSLIVPITEFTATDAVGVTGYKLTETSDTPTAEESGWESSPQTSYTFLTPGIKTLYAWAKDEAGNVSTSHSGSVTINLSTYTLINFISAITNWLQIGNETSDVNSDGVVNTRDLGVMMSNWGE